MDTSDSDSEEDLPLLSYQNAGKPLIQKTITDYLAKKSVSSDVDPLTWWKVKKRNYEQLLPVVRNHLVTPPTSVPSEQMFSGVGLIYTSRRNRLDAKKASKLLFLKFNIPRLKYE
nr:unnamed protein product [Callosobruchus analis]